MSRDFTYIFWRFLGLESILYRTLMKPGLKSSVRKLKRMFTNKRDPNASAATPIYPADEHDGDPLLMIHDHDLHHNLDDIETGFENADTDMHQYQQQQQSVSLSRSDSDQDSTHMCRICLADDQQHDLIAPCACRGGQKWVHRACLDEWRAQERQPFAFSRCPTCHFNYIIETKPINELLERKRKVKFVALVLRDLFLFISAIISVIIAFALLLKLLDFNKTIPNILLGSIVSQGGFFRALLPYILVSIIILLAIFGLFGSCFMCFHRQQAQDICPSCFHFVYWDCTEAACCADVGGGGAELVAFGALIVLVFAGLGLFLGLLFSFALAKKVIAKHIRVVWMRGEAAQSRVMDLRDRPDLL